MSKTIKSAVFNAVMMIFLKPLKINRTTRKESNRKCAQNQNRRNITAAVSEMDDSVSAAVVFMPPAKLSVMIYIHTHTHSG